MPTDETILQLPEIASLNGSDYFTIVRAGDPIPNKRITRDAAFGAMLDGALVRAANLADVPNKPTARTNLELGPLATEGPTIHFGINVVGNVTATAFIGNGSGLTGVGSAGGVINAGGTTIGADSDANGIGTISFQIANVERASLENDGSFHAGSLRAGEIFISAGAGGTAKLSQVGLDLFMIESGKWQFKSQASSLVFSVTDVAANPYFVIDSAGAPMVQFRGDLGNLLGTPGGTFNVIMASGRVIVGPVGTLEWRSAAGAAVDTRITRKSAGYLQIEATAAGATGLLQAAGISIGQALPYSTAKLLIRGSGAAGDLCIQQLDAAGVGRFSVNESGNCLANTLASGMINYSTARLSLKGGTIGASPLIACFDSASTNVFMMLDNGSFTTLGGIVAGAATGGQKGAGMINIAGDIYKNNVAYTNPHGGFERAYTGKLDRFAEGMAALGLADYEPLTIEDLENYTRANFHFPYFGDDQENGLFGGAERHLLITEELAVHLFNLNRRLNDLEARLARGH